MDMDMDGKFHIHGKPGNISGTAKIHVERKLLLTDYIKLHTRYIFVATCMTLNDL